jgi:16S rRNA (uracil1498-N3)-methyltransferase
VLRAEESHYLRRVLRLRPGDQLALVDGAGRLWSARLEPGDGAGGDAVVVLEQPLAAPLQQQPPPHPQLVLAVAWPRLDADVLLRMACELGIDRFTPLQAGRSVAAAGLKPERQAAIVREAVEQCERLWQPQLDPEQPALDWLGRVARQGEGGAAAAGHDAAPGVAQPRWAAGGATGQGPAGQSGSWWRSGRRGAGLLRRNSAPRPPAGGR